MLTNNNTGPLGRGYT